MIERVESSSFLIDKQIIKKRLSQITRINGREFLGRSKGCEIWLQAGYASEAKDITAFSTKPI